METFYRGGSVPVFCNVLHADSETARRSPTGVIRLGYCRSCGHVHNIAFDPDLVSYGPGYENSLDFSPSFRDYMRMLAADLVERHGLRGKDIVEIGCGRGEFLRELCEAAGSRGVGFDPSLMEDVAPPAGVTLLRDLYSASYSDVRADFVCSRHMLEQLPDPRNFVEQLREVLGGRGHVRFFFEVPNGAFVFSELSLWDVIYEHVSLFTGPSLARLFEISGFAVSRLFTSFSGRFLCVEASLGGASGGRLAYIENSPEAPGAEDVGAFAARCAGKLTGWNRHLALWIEKRTRIVVWGAGSKGIMFVNLVEDPGAVAALVDINPRKQGLFAPGTGHRILSPEELPALRPDVVLVMNRVYEHEIGEGLAGQGLWPELLVA
ncbi:MAG: class I SAM-dependent methyltransferase [Thermoleophilia bacterium]|nr:class I SAM-dependent methyltransferase [Thermoleophilia bacterium]